MPAAITFAALLPVTSGLADSRKQTTWEFLATYHGADRSVRLLQRFAVGELRDGSCSGAMVSPHLYLTAAHCGGPGWTGSVQFFRQDSWSNAYVAVIEMIGRVMFRR